MTNIRHRLATQYHLTMSHKSIQLDDGLYQYLLSHSLREPALLTQLREETAQHPLAGMQISPEQGQFMAWLIQLIAAKRIVEIGVFTGYSSLAMALALPADGHITACDVSRVYTDIARRYWAQAGVESKIELQIGFAMNTLQRLIADGQAGSYDMVFIDADKCNYTNYYECGLTLLRNGGVLLVDNVLWSGKVADASIKDEDTEAIRALNRLMHQDPRVSLSVLPVADGLAMAIKR